MAIKRVVGIVVLQGEEELLVKKYATLITNGYRVFLDGVRYGVMEIDQGDLAGIYKGNGLRRWYELFENAVPMKLQDATKLGK